MSKTEGKVSRVWVGEANDPLGEWSDEDIRRATRRKRYRRYTMDSVTFVSKYYYTCAIVQLHHEIKGGVSGVGFAKCRPTDKYDELVGQRIAMRRAIEDAVNA